MRTDAREIRLYVRIQCLENVKMSNAPYCPSFARELFQCWLWTPNLIQWTTNVPLLLLPDPWLSRVSKHSIVSMIDAISCTSIIPSLSTSYSLNTHANLLSSVWQVAMSMAKRNSLKSRNPLPSESNILMICVLNFSPSPFRRNYVYINNLFSQIFHYGIPLGKACRNKILRWSLVSLPSGQSFLNLLNQSMIWSSVKLVFSTQNLMSSGLK